MDFGALFGIFKDLLPAASALVTVAGAIAHYFVIRKNKVDHGLLIDKVAAAVSAVNSKVHPAPPDAQSGGAA